MNQIVYISCMSVNRNCLQCIFQVIRLTTTEVIFRDTYDCSIVAATFVTVGADPIAMGHVLAVLKLFFNLFFNFAIPSSEKPVQKIITHKIYINKCMFRQSKILNDGMKKSNSFLR